jgi:hypothetical protein
VCSVQHTPLYLWGFRNQFTRVAPLPGPLNEVCNIALAIFNNCQSVITSSTPGIAVAPPCLHPMCEGASAILQGVVNCRRGKSGFRGVQKLASSKGYQARISITVLRTQKMLFDQACNALFPSCVHTDVDKQANHSTCYQQWQQDVIYCLFYPICLCRPLLWSISQC